MKTGGTIELRERGQIGFYHVVFQNLSPCENYREIELLIDFTNLDPEARRKRWELFLLSPKQVPYISELKKNKLTDINVFMECG
ncbi:hypothetical protein MtrunA17_Chr8g0370531 [Medicago truncatula]|uniref:Uncharacterized protein n=1 Tax=Medicago truncatula TaxID=3880 RepID=G7L9E5_MEDTR|nr:hypothetical protein MTR_8g073720 [Medicago truncatula]RHN41860.1 hypothetical protein MtrunA17_Chr8g0370531 [Medicago truncatula]